MYRKFYFNKGTVYLDDMQLKHVLGYEIKRRVTDPKKIEYPIAELTLTIMVDTSLLECRVDENGTPYYKAPYEV
jgi:hypothetical protein